MDERVRRALAAIGSFDEEASRRLEESAREIRGTWRGLVSAGEAAGEPGLYGRPLTGAGSPGLS